MNSAKKKPYLQQKKSSDLANGVIKVHKDGYYEVCFYVDGVRHGFVEYYYTCGQLGIRGNYKNGKEHGLWESFSFFGKNKLECKGHFKNGKKDGIWEYYDIQDGQLINLEYFINGKEVRAKDIPS